METQVSELRAHLKDVLATARGGEDVVVTERGLPIVRISAEASTPLLRRLSEQGKISTPSAPRPHLSASDRVEATGPVSDLVGEQRR